MSTWKKEEQCSTARDAYIGNVPAYTAPSSSVQASHPIHEQNKALCCRVHSCFLMAFKRAFDSMAAVIHVASHPKSRDFHVMSSLAFLVFPSGNFKRSFSPVHWGDVLTPRACHSSQGTSRNSTAICRSQADPRATVSLGARRAISPLPCTTF